MYSDRTSDGDRIPGKRAILFLILGLAATRAFAATRLTVDQLENGVTVSKGQSDSKIAGYLSSIQLTERPSTTELTAMEAALPGPESRQALVLLADQAAFLAPPPAEIPTNRQPGFADQRAIIAKAVEYVRGMQLRLPDLSAARETVHFEDSPPGLKAGTIGGSFTPFQPLHQVSRTTVAVTYRSGNDYVQVSGKEQPASILKTRGLSSFGEFGPILSNVLIDLPQGKLAWSHWEKRAAMSVAVFRFSVPKAASHYELSFCCVGARRLQQFSAYHGEITINPGDGTILRITLLADLGPDDLVIRADLMVEYSPIQLGERSYFCPSKSISRWIAPASAADDLSKDYLADTPMQTMLNEVYFERYVFQSASRVTEDRVP